VKPQPTTVAKATEKEEANPKAKPSTGKESSSQSKTPDDPTRKNGAGGSNTGQDPSAEASLEDDVQLQKAVELLKTWKIFKELRPST
jgi:carboxyl-terminal processing protease